MTTGVVSFAALVLTYALFAGTLRRLHVSAPMAFVAAGSVIGFLGHARTAEQVIWVKVIADITLALLLFHDAAQIRPRDLRAVGPVAGRLLVIGTPLAVLLGLLAARLLLPGQPIMLALLVAAALAPTDAGLGAPVLLNRAVPVKVRSALNVESGLNDGLITPVVLFALASLAGAESRGPVTSTAQAVLSIAVGVLVGAAVGAAGAILLGWSRSRGFSGPSVRTLGVLALPVLAFGAAELVHGNAFVSAFVAGAAFAAAGRWLPDEESAFALTEASAELLGIAVWLLFGLVVVPQLWDAVGWREVVYAVLSLTLVRLVPVVVSLAGTGLRAPTVLFMGWFGPRGLATVVFTLLAIETLEVDGTLRQALLAVSLTVLLSVVAHGLSAEPLALRYAAWVERAQPPVETGEAHEPRPRGTLAARGVMVSSTLPTGKDGE